MLVDKITLTQALELERVGEIVIYDTGKESNPPYHPRQEEWRNNFIQLRTKARHIPRNKISEHYSSRYLIEYPLGCVDIETGTYQWKYLRGIENTQDLFTPRTDTEYVYVLVNKQYEGLVKIGMTRHSPGKRLRQINGTGTVYEWELKFALPLKIGSAYRVEQQVHKYFQHLRHHASSYNDREMFRVDLFQAIDRVRKVGKIFQAGTPILY